MLVAQITDLHVRPKGKAAYGIVDTEAHLRRLIATLNDLDPKPDLVLATGDLTDFGLPEENAHLAELLALINAPVRPVMGNHDIRENFQEVFGGRNEVPATGFVNYTVELDPIRVVILDSVRAGSHEGLLDTERLAWLDETLAMRPTTPSLLALHHPPVSTRLKHNFDFPGANELGAVIAKHGQVRRVICGHNHEVAHVPWHGSLVSVAPSSAHQHKFDALNPDPRFLIHMSTPGFMLYHWRPDLGASGDFVAFWVPVGPFEGPYEVTWARDAPDASVARLVKDGPS